MIFGLNLAFLKKKSPTGDISPVKETLNYSRWRGRKLAVGARLIKATGAAELVGGYSHS
jgi:hypothetical protein